MKFSLIEQEAREFMITDTTGSLQLLRTDEEQGRIYLSSAVYDIEFYITCPSDETTEWGLWSDNPKLIEVCTYILDNLNPDSKSISTVLATISKRMKSESFHKVWIGSNGRDKDTEMVSDTSSLQKCAKSDEIDQSDSDEEFDDYYVDEDLDVEADIAQAKEQKEKEEEADLEASFFLGNGSPVAVKRLIKDLKGLKNSGADLGITASPRGNNVFVWDVMINDVPTSTKLGKDLVEYAHKYKEIAAIKLDMQFPPDYPFSPPFIRVVKPRFKFLTGHVTIGGSICMQMLTKSGWRPTNDIESILVQVRCEILSDSSASLDPTRPDRCYTEAEAKDAFKRMVAKYGW